MKFHLIILAALFAFAATEPPRFNRRFRFQRVEQAPYGPAGTRPVEEFRLPARQQNPPTLYGPPPQEYGPPEESVPEATEDDFAAATTTEIPTTTTYTPARAQLRDRKRKPERIQKEEVLDQGTYYIYHPNGFLQRVMYQTSNDVRNMEYKAQLTYKDVEPIREPVYTYDPESYVLQQITYL